jgi:hypothetical protein
MYGRAWRNLLSHHFGRRRHHGKGGQSLHTLTLTPTPTLALALALALTLALTVTLTPDLSP